MAKGRKTGGRKQGSRNKTTVIAKEAIAIAAERLGGVDRLVSWAQESPDNEKAFWVSIYTKLLPLQVTGENGGPVQTVTRIELVAEPHNGDSADQASPEADPDLYG